MNPQKPLLVFDFDGVICNSIHDSMMTAINAYIRLVPDHRLPVRAPLSPETVFGFEKKHPDFFRRFSRIMPLGRGAEDYLTVIGLLDKGEDMQVADQSAFDGIHAAVPGNRVKEYHDEFYRVREAIREKDPALWSRGFPPFPEVIQVLPALGKRFELCIATSKDRISVEYQLNATGLSVHFAPDHILDKEAGKSKRIHLSRLQKQFRVPFSRIHFIDDKVSHLISVEDLGVHGYLALWGFNTEREKAEALSHGFTCLRLEELRLLGIKSSGGTHGE